MIFGRYRVLRELGRGGMGVVYLAHDTALDVHVAVKLVPDIVVRDTEAIVALRKEVLRGMALMHPGIVRTHNFEKNEDSAGIVMEFVEGDTLTDLNARQPGQCFDPEQILPWIEQLCAVLDYAHRDARIVHRDLKPGNIMLTPAGRIKVADFGLAAVLSDSMSRHSMEGQISGTLSYMSPQQAEGKRPTHLDDIHALGATIYELLTGKPPFFRGTLAAIMAQVLKVIPPSLAERREDLEVTGKASIPLAWEQTVAACLAKRPAARPQSASEVVTRLKISGRKTAPQAPTRRQPKSKTRAPSPPIVRVPVQQPSRRRALATLVSVLELFVLGGTDSRRRALATLVSGVIVILAAWAGVYYLSGRRRNEINRASVPSLSSTPVLAARITASMDAPFVNSFGMQFVPVPIKGGPSDGQDVYFCIWDTRVQDYEEFVKANKRKWEKPEFTQGPTHPAVNVNWTDAHDFCQWLTVREQASGKLPANLCYRLPSDHEWSCAVGIGEREDAKASPKDKNDKIPDVFPWGTQWPPPPGAGNYADDTAKNTKGGVDYISGYDDGFAYTSPVGSFAANRFGLYDLGGNVWQWCEDWYDGTPTYWVVRGGAWNTRPRDGLFSSFRLTAFSYAGLNHIGFRCVLAPSVR